MADHILDAILPSLKDLQQSKVEFLTGTVRSGGVVPIIVVMDSDPTSTSVTANSNITGPLALGTRVVLVRASPGLLMVLGVLGGDGGLNSANGVVLVYNLLTSAYPPRPAGVAAGQVTYKGPAEPTDAITPDTWEDTTGIWP